VSSPSRVWGHAPAENEFGVFIRQRTLLLEGKNNMFIDNYSGANKQINMNQLKSTNPASYYEILIFDGV